MLSPSRARGRWAAGLLGLSVTACAGPGLPSPETVDFDTAQARVVEDGSEVELTVELACTEEQQMVGLAERDELDAGTGMLFRFPEERDASEGFWMWRTRIPLDIAFMDRDGTILAIRSMEPCPADDPDACPVHEAGVGHWGALETPQGWFAEEGVGVGARLEVDEGCPGTRPPNGPAAGAP